MKHFARWFALVVLVGFVSAAPALARQEAPISALTARVTDTTGTLSAQERATLEQTLTAFEARKGSQIAVLLVPTTQPETIEQFSIRVAEAWKVGRKNVDDGALLIVARDDRTLRIEVGYGLEGALTDLASRRIIDEIIVPRFKQGDISGGISAGVDSMMRVIDGEPLPAPTKRRGGSGGFSQLLPVLFVVAVAAGGVLRSILGRLPGALATGGLIGLLTWLLAGTFVFAIAAGFIALVFTLLGGGFGAYAAGRYVGGRGGFGGGTNRDIVRGGGGGFGGGGASGRW